jgi:hypothetical protein
MVKEHSNNIHRCENVNLSLHNPLHDTDGPQRKIATDY